MILREAPEHGPCRPEEGCDDCFAGEPERDEAGCHEGRCRDLDRRVERADPDSARTAAAAEHQVGEDGDVVIPAKLRAAAHAGRARVDDRAPQRHARSDDVHEAPESESRPEREHTESDVHLRVIGGLPLEVER